MINFAKKLAIATYRGRGKLFNQIIRTLDRTEYSHTECGLYQEPGDLGWLCWSSSFMDGGVRTKIIKIQDRDKWDVIYLPVTDEEWNYAKHFAEARDGQKYDTLGMLGAGFMIPKQEKNKQFCNELVGGMIMLQDPHRYRPASFRIIADRIAKERLRCHSKF